MEVLTAYSSTTTLARAIEKRAEEGGHDPYLIRMAERAKAIQEDFDRGRTDEARALERLFRQIELSDRRRDHRARALDTESV